VDEQTRQEFLNKANHRQQAYKQHELRFANPQ
jgi:hypothetical protein